MQARIFAVTWLSYAGFYFCRKNFSVIMPLLSRDEGFTADRLALALFLYSLGYIAGQFSSGLLSDRFGARRVVTAGMLVSAGVNAAVGFSESAAAITTLWAANGYAQACGWPGLLKLMSSWFSERSRGTTMGWWSTNMVAGGFLATIFATWAATGPLMAAWGWRRGAWWPAAVLAAIAIVFWTFVRDGASEKHARPSPYAGLREVMANRTVNTIAAMYFAIKLARYVFLFWLPLYMTEKLGYGADEAGYTSSVFELVGALGVPLAGYLSDRVTLGRRFPVGAAMMFALALLCLAHPALAAMGRWGNIAGIALIGVMTFGPDTLMAGAAVQDSVRRDVTATAGGYINGIGSMGQLISPLLASAVSRAYGWDAVFYLLVGVAAAGGAALATQWNFRRPEWNLATSPS
jgi:sugar phosphate permease